jgi:hypothetical protein
MECDFHRTLYKRRLNTTRGMSTSQPRGSQESSQKTPSKWSFRRTRRGLQKYSEICSTRLRRARGLVRPEVTKMRT